jgi:hypothetical protein
MLLFIAQQRTSFAKTGGMYCPNEFLNHQLVHDVVGLTTLLENSVLVVTYVHHSPTACW